MNNLPEEYLSKLASQPHRPIFDETVRFVNRDDDKKQIEKYVRTLKQKRPLQEQLLNVVGVPGIGKSALFQEFYTHYRTDAELVVLGYSVKKETSATLESSFPFNIALQLAAYDSHIEALDIAQVTEQLLGYSKRHGKSILILIDGCEYLSMAQRDWLEDGFMRPVLIQSRSFILVSSQAEINWKSYELRRRSDEALELGSLQEQFIRQLADVNDIPKQELNQLVEQTNGFPLALMKLVEGVKEGTPGKFLTETIHAIRERGIGELQDEQLWKVLQLLSILREFDVEMVHSLVPQVVPNHSDMTQAEAFELISRLVATRLCRADTSIRAYRVPSPIRAIIATEYVLQSTASYGIAQRIHAHALKEYHQRIETVPRSRERYLLEYCYHWALYKPETPNYNSLIGRFANILREYYVSADGEHIERKSLEQLKKNLLTDSELAGVLQDHGLLVTSLSSEIENLLDQHKGKSDFVDDTP